MQSVRQWLEGIGLGEYAEALERNRIDLEIAKELNDQDLRELGIEALGHRKRLLKAIAQDEAVTADLLQGTGDR